MSRSSQVFDEIGRVLRHRRIALAESCTAGRIAKALAKVDDASEFFAGGIVPYSEDAKRRLLRVEADSIYSRAAAEEMAIGALHLFKADVAVATTGVAGDEPEDGVDPGTVFIATAIGDAISCSRYEFTGTPDDICDQARDQAGRDLLLRLGTSS